MRLIGVCVLTNNSLKLSNFYTTVLQEQPFVEGNHYGFHNAQLSVWDPGDVSVVHDKSMTLMFAVNDLEKEYKRLRCEIPGLIITSPPERRPWGAYSFWFLDPDGNTISLVEEK